MHSGERTEATAPALRLDINGRTLGALGVLLSRGAWPPASAGDSEREGNKGKDSALE
jgi:hypothetical protein